MKTKMVALFLIAAFINSQAYCQEVPDSKKLRDEHTYSLPTTQISSAQIASPRVYRDTRLGGSSPLYNTYKKNDYGAGAITTNPSKNDGTGSYFYRTPDSSNLTSQISRDTRLGGSSPLYNTYKKNDYGAGAITTNPEK